jgi:hypothetical protein
MITLPKNSLQGLPSRWLPIAMTTSNPYNWQILEKKGEE